MKCPQVKNWLHVADIFQRKRWDSNPRAREGYLISSQARYDHFDTLPNFHLAAVKQINNAIWIFILNRDGQGYYNPYALYKARMRFYMKWLGAR